MKPLTPAEQSNGGAVDFLQADRPVPNIASRSRRSFLGNLAARRPWHGHRRDHDA